MLNHDQPAADTSPAYPAAYAHRGGAALWPENTLAAFQRAAALGFEHFETDVHLTRDGVLVTCHDEDVARTTDGTGLIRDHNLQDLKRLDAGYRFTVDDGASFPFRGQGIEVPELAEVLDALPEAFFTIEIKATEPQLAQELLRVLDAHGGRRRVIVGSFHLGALREVRRLSDGTIATSAGPAEALRFWLLAAFRSQRLVGPRYGFLQVPETRGRLRVVTPHFVAAAHNIGLKVHVWTVNETADMRRLLRWGVDGILSDRPDVLLRIIKDWKGSLDS